MDAETAIRRLSFAQAQHSTAEAMTEMARHRTELAREAEAEGVTEAQAADDFAQRAREAHQVDKTA